MKANELMIFDLVRRKKDNRTMIVVEVGYDENIGAITTDDRFYGDFEDYHETQVEPIPLTPEILEKNGFEPYEEGGGFHNDECVFIEQTQGGFVTCIESKRTISGLLRYVHELQHTLRLCGIKKEIVL